MREHFLLRQNFVVDEAFRLMIIAPLLIGLLSFWPQETNNYSDSNLDISAIGTQRSFISIKRTVADFAYNFNKNEVLSIAAEIYSLSQLYDLEPSLIMAVIQVESGFKKYQISRSNALGLMQIKYATAKEQARLSKIPFEHEDDLFDPITNIKIGTAYLRRLLDLFDQDTELATSAYYHGMRRIEENIPLPPDMLRYAYKVDREKRKIKNRLHHHTNVINLIQQEQITRTDKRKNKQKILDRPRLPPKPHGWPYSPLPKHSIKMQDLSVSATNKQL